MAINPNFGNLLSKLSGLTILILAFSCLTPAFPDPLLPRVIISSGGPYTSKELKTQTFRDAINLPQAYCEQPLSLVFTNGSESTPGYTWLRVFLQPNSADSQIQTLSQPIGRLLIDENSFLSTSRVFLDMTRELGSGQNKIYIEGAGPQGAAFNWELRTIAAPIISGDYFFAFPGETFTLYGSGFSLRPEENTVTLGAAIIPVLESNFNCLKIAIPANFAPGSYDLAVAIWSYQSKIKKITLQKPAKNDS